jgi:hypothetical protein
MAARARPATFEMLLAYPSPVSGQVELRRHLASHAARPPGNEKGLLRFAAQKCRVAGESERREMEQTFFIHKK